MGQSLSGSARARRRRRRSGLIGRVVARALWLAALLFIYGSSVRAQPASSAMRLDEGRITVVAYPSDLTLARTLLRAAVTRDSFPGLPRPRERVVIAVAPDASHFRLWGGRGAPEWGAALAFPESHRIVMHGRAAGSDAGDPVSVLRHELAHLALHEALGDLPPRWFDEGYASYAANEWTRDDALTANVALLVRGVPSLDSLDAYFAAGAGRAQDGYALAYRAVAELAALDEARGLTLFFEEWKRTGRFDAAVRAAYGVTADDFERRWRSRTRLRYGALAVVTNVSLLTLVLLAVLGPGWRARRRRDRARLEAMREADARADARAAALDAILRDPPPPELGPERMPTA